MKKVFLFLPLFFVLFSCSQTIKYTVDTPKSSLSNPKNGQSNRISQHDGQCYKNCIAPDRYESKWVAFPIYTGSDPEAPMRTETLVVQPPRNQWVKLNTGEISLVETPAVTKTVQVLADTFFYKDYRRERFETKVLAEKGGSMRETPVVCSDERTPNLFLQISAALKTYGYMEEAKAQWDMKFSQAIQQFQKANSLPVGDLNLETLQFLGI